MPRGDLTIVQSVFAVHHTHRHPYCHHCHRFAYTPTSRRTFYVHRVKGRQEYNHKFNLWLVGSIKCSRLAFTINNTIFKISQQSFIIRGKNDFVEVCKNLARHFTKYKCGFNTIRCVYIISC